jgi:hypothetical protein
MLIVGCSKSTSPIATASAPGQPLGMSSQLQYLETTVDSSGVNTVSTKTDTLSYLVSDTNASLSGRTGVWVFKNPTAPDTSQNLILTSNDASGNFSHESWSAHDTGSGTWLFWPTSTLTGSTYYKNSTIIGTQLRNETKTVYYLGTENVNLPGNTTLSTIKCANVTTQNYLDQYLNFLHGQTDSTVDWYVPAIHMYAKEAHLLVLSDSTHVLYVSNHSEQLLSYIRK